MPWQVKSNKELRVIEVVFTDTVTQEDVQDATAQALTLAAGDGPHLFLADLSDAHSMLSVQEIYAIPDQWDAARPHRNNRLALIVPGWAGKPDVRFYEIVAINRGWNVRVFDARPVSINWLING